MAVLIDTNVLLAAAFTRDTNYPVAQQLLRSLEREGRVVPISVLNELFYMATIRISYERAVDIFKRTTRTFEIMSLPEIDMLRMQDIMAQYRDAQFDFADVSIMALAERLQITRICTFDRRDFSIFKPKHCDYFELLP